MRRNANMSMQSGNPDKAIAQADRCLKLCPASLDAVAIKVRPRFEAMLECWVSGCCNLHSDFKMEYGFGVLFVFRRPGCC